MLHQIPTKEALNHWNFKASAFSLKFLIVSHRFPKYRLIETKRDKKELNKFLTIKKIERELPSLRLSNRAMSLAHATM